MKNKEWKIIITFIIFGCLFCLIFYILGPQLEIEQELAQTVIVDELTAYKYKNNTWILLDDLEELTWENYDVYQKTGYIDNYYLSLTNNKWYFFDENEKSHKIISPYLAITKDSNISPLKVELSNNLNQKDYENISKYLKKQKINYNGEYSTLEKHTVDLNNDEKDDYIYIISNELYDINPFYIVFACYNNKNIEIINQINTENSTNYEVGWILKTEENKLNTIILREYKYDNYSYTLIYYNKKNKSYVNSY